MEVYERLDDLDADKALVRAGKILFGLGFSKQMQHTQVKNFSGKCTFIYPAIYINPTRSI